MKYQRPFLKWPGGKYRLLSHIGKHLPQRKVLVEPFVGAGAVFLNHEYEQYWLNDINPDLINLFKLLKKLGPKFIVDAEKWFKDKNNKPEKYYAYRERFNDINDLEEKAFLFLYLNRHGYNGLCRYNNSGFYNVPFGRYKQTYFPKNEMLGFLSIAARTKFFNQDFDKVMLKARKFKEDAVIYCDPPYAPLSKTANFTNYAQVPFPIELQSKLSGLARDVAKDGVKILISNHDLPLTRKIYKGAKIVPLKVQRVISCAAKERRKVSELIAIF